MLYFERISQSVCVHEQVAKRTWNVRFTVMCKLWFFYKGVLF